MPTTFFGWVFFLMEEYGPVLLTGAGVTLLLAVVGTIVGCLIGLVVGIIQTIPVEKHDNLFKKIVGRAAQIIMRVYVEVFRGTPIVVQLLVTYYFLLPVFGIKMTGLSVCEIIFGLNSAAYVCEIMRSGI